MIKCKNVECGKLVEKRGNVYCSLKCRNVYVNKYLRDYSKVSSTMRAITSKRYEEQSGPFKEHISKCEYCGREIINIFRENKKTKKLKRFCDRKCSLSKINDENKTKPRFLSEEGLQKLIEKASINGKRLWQDEEYVKKQLSNNKIFSSKGEKEFVKFFQGKYPDDCWTFGGALKHEGEILVRDLFSKKLKICFEYDGIWHFKDIKNQLAQKQLKDKLLEDWCHKNNWRIIRIKEEVYQSDKEKYINYVDDIIYNQPEIKLLKIYE